MKISAAEWVALGLTAVFLAFSAGWLARGGGNAAPVRIETEQTLTAEEQAADLPPVTATEEPGALKPGEKININTAGADERQRLPGIGEKRAADIVADRAENGPFRIPEDLTRVSGIGEGTLERILEYITVEGAGAP